VPPLLQQRDPYFWHISGPHNTSYRKAAGRTSQQRRHFFCKNSLNLRLRGMALPPPGYTPLSQTMGPFFITQLNPVLVSFIDTDKKFELFRKLKELKSADDKFKSISIAHDLAPRQVDRYFRL